MLWGKGEREPDEKPKLGNRKLGTLGEGVVAFARRSL